MSLNGGTISKVARANAEERTVTAGFWKKIFLCKRGGKWRCLLVLLTSHLELSGAVSEDLYNARCAICSVKKLHKDITQFKYMYVHGILIPWKKLVG